LGIPSQPFFDEKEKPQSSRFGEKAGELAGGEYNPKKKERKERGELSVLL